jgi:hypothetical protein
VDTAMAVDGHRGGGRHEGGNISVNGDGVGVGWR